MKKKPDPKSQQLGREAVQRLESEQREQKRHRAEVKRMCCPPAKQKKS